MPNARTRRSSQFSLAGCPAGLSSATIVHEYPLRRHETSAKGHREPRRYRNGRASDIVLNSSQSRTPTDIARCSASLWTSGAGICGSLFARVKLNGLVQLWRKLLHGNQKTNVYVESFKLNRDVSKVGVQMYTNLGHAQCRSVHSPVAFLLRAETGCSTSYKTGIT